MPAAAGAKKRASTNAAKNKAKVRSVVCMHPL